MNWDAAFEAAREDRASPSGGRYPVRVNAYAELEDGREVEVIGRAEVERGGYTSFIDDVEILAVRLDPSEEEVPLEDLSEVDEDILIDAIESAALEVS